MEIKKTNVHLAYKIEEKPGGGFIARSDDPGVEPIEAATKVELFEKMRAKTAEIIGKEIPLNFGSEKASDINLGGANIHVDRKFSVNVIHKSNDPSQPSQNDPNWVSNSDAQLASQGSSSSAIWKIAFFVLLALVIAWFVLHR